MSIAELYVGDPAPRLHLAEVLRGEPIDGLAPGKVAVVEFWSPTCAPCVQSIPHLAALQAAYPEVTILGVAVRLSDEVRAFVRDQGEAMAYTVAADAPREHGTMFGPTSLAWCEASFQQGIPASFIVDGEGRIAWIGHPMDLDAPLAAVVEGRWDLAAEAEAYRAEVARTKMREITRMRAAVMRLIMAGDKAGALRVFDETFAAHPDLERHHGIEKLSILSRESPDALLAYARHLLALIPGESRSLLQIGSTLSGQAGRGPDQKQPADPALAALALDALRQAERVPPTDGAPDDLIWFHTALARAFLDLERSGAALTHLDAARNLAATEGLEEAWRERLDALAERCAAAAPPPESEMVCEEGVCRIAAA